MGAIWMVISQRRSLGRKDTSSRLEFGFRQAAGWHPGCLPRPLLGWGWVTIGMELFGAASA